MVRTRAAAPLVVCETEVRGPARDRDDRWAQFQSAMTGLRGRLRGNGASDLVLPDLLEDDLRQVRIALHALSDALDGVLDVVGDPASSAMDVLHAARAAPTVEQIDSLAELAPQVKKRLVQVAQRLAQR